MKIIGIDLGTSNSVLCEYKRGDTRVINIEGNPILPSVVHIKDGQVSVGKIAKNRLLIDANRCLSSTKRQIGSDWSKEIDGKAYSAIDAAMMILSHLKAQDPEIEDVVITIPAYFEDEQRKQTKEAAKQAGLNVLRLLPEPTAAAIKYGFQQEKDQTILVVDLGGGTFDVSLLEVKDNNFTVKAVDGNHQLGGDDFDMAIVKYINQWVENNLGADKAAAAIADSTTQQKFKEAAEQVKIELAELKKVDITIFGAVDGQDVEINDFTRTKFQELIQEYLDEIVAKTQSVIAQSNLTLDDINRVVLVGGSCKHPIVQEIIESNFKKPYISPNMDTAVAEGAAIVCSSLMTLKEEKTIKKGEKIRDNKKLSEEDKLGTELIFEDVVSHSLGIDMQDSKGILGIGQKLIFVPIIEKNTNYPCQGAVIGGTQKTQEKITMTVYRGEDSNPIKNTKLGELEVKIPQQYVLETSLLIAAVFEIDDSGVLTFTEVEMPIMNPGIDDLKALAEEANANKQRVLPTKIWELKDRYNYNSKKITIKK
jgi:molecular chaperone DnaK